MFERFTERARYVVVLAQDEARTLKHNYIGTEHILLGLLREEEGLAARVLRSFGITLEEVRAQVARIIGQGVEVTAGQIPFTPRAKKVLELALREALSLGHNYIGTEHILLGLVRENDGVGARILRDFGADADKIRSEIMHVLSGSAGERAPREVEPGIMIHCPRCDAPVESVGTAMTSGRFAVEGHGERTCDSCGAVWHLSYRVEWRMAGDEGG
jgi:ATP-dependent Clp protease ATP-binding subunit ClpA